MREISYDSLSKYQKEYLIKLNTIYDKVFQQPWKRWELPLCDRSINRNLSHVHLRTKSERVTNLLRNPHKGLEAFSLLKVYRSAYRQVR